MDRRGDFQRFEEKIKMPTVIIVANKPTLKRVVDRAFLETMFLLSIIHSEHPSLLNYMEGVTKAGIDNECRSTRNIHANPLPSANFIGGLSQAPVPNSAQS